MGDMLAIALYDYVSRHLVKAGMRGFYPNVRDNCLSRHMDLDSD